MVTSRIRDEVLEKLLGTDKLALSRVHMILEVWRSAVS
jgi:hypothetical protein